MKAKWIAVVLLFGGLAWFAQRSNPPHGQPYVVWDSPKDRAWARLKGLPKVKKFELANVSLEEAVAQLNRCFKNSTASASAIGFRVWREGDPVPKEMHRIGAVPVPDASTIRRDWESDTFSVADFELGMLPSLVASLYRCEFAVTDDAIVFYPKGSLVSEMIERRYYLMWRLGDPTVKFPGATRISAGKWDLQSWVGANDFNISTEGYAYYEESGNKLVIYGPRDELLLIGATLSGSCSPTYADSSYERVRWKAYMQWWSLRQKFFPPPPMPPMPSIPITPSSPRSDEIPGLEGIPKLPDAN